VIDDVGVVGGGPGGAAAALALARAGARVTLYRPARPGEKPCGGAIPEAFLPAIAGFRQPAAPSVCPALLVLENAAGSRVELEAAGLRIFRRADFDASLESAARAAGARVVDSRAQQVVVAPAGGGVEVGAGGERRRFGWLVGADGARGLTRRALGLQPGAESVGLGASLQGPVPDRLVLGFPDAADAYCWIFPRPGGASVGIAYDPGWLSQGAAAAALDRFLDRHLDHGRPLRRSRRGDSSAPASAVQHVPELAAAHRYRYPIPVYGAGTRAAIARGSQSRVLLVGDAAGVADPLTREGIRYALLSGRWAAESLLDDRPATYPDRVEAGLEPELGRAGRAARLFYDEPIAQWMVPVARRHPAIRSVLGELLTCRQPYRGLRRRLLGAAIGRYACAAADTGGPTPHAPR
jgi:flavin-dependent dehydrogenase